MIRVATVTLVIVGGLSEALLALMSHRITSAVSLTVRPRAFQHRGALTHVRVDERLYIQKIEEWWQEPKLDLLDGSLLRWRRDQPRLDSGPSVVV